MKLLTKALEKRFAQVGSQEHIDDPMVICKFFYPMGAATWWATEYDPENKTFFGYANLGDDEMAELGYFSLEELETFKGRFGVGIERDLHFDEQPLSKFKK